MKNQKEIFLILFIIILLCTLFYAVGYKKIAKPDDLESKFPFLKKENESKIGFTELNQMKKNRQIIDTKMKLSLIINV